MESSRKPEEQTTAAVAEAAECANREDDGHVADDEGHPELTEEAIENMGDEELAAKIADVKARMADDAKKRSEEGKFTLEDGFVVDYNKEPDVSQIKTEVEADGYRRITWRELKYIWCYERPAHGMKLVGDISQKHSQYWDRSKQIKLRDSEGKEGAIFFYDDNEPEPFFSWENVEVGNHIEVVSPRLHKFMDGQDGIRVEEHKMIRNVTRQKFTDLKRLEYGRLNKENGNAAFARASRALAEEFAKGNPGGEALPHSVTRLFDDAMTSYEMAIGHLEVTLHESDSSARQEAKEIVASCFLNVAACQTAMKKWPAVEMPCERALAVNASPLLNAKAYFRIGQALLEMGEPGLAEEKLKRADQLAPGDGKIIELLQRIAARKREQVEAERALFKLRKSKREKTLAEVKSSNGGILPDFGLKRSLFGPPPSGLKGVPSFRDLGGLLCNDGRTVTKKFLLYRTSSLFMAATGAEQDEGNNDIRTLTHIYGIKTIIEMRNEHESQLQLERERAARGGQASFRDYRDYFTTIKVICKAATKPAPKVDTLSSPTTVAHPASFGADTADSQPAAAAFPPSGERGLLKWLLYYAGGASTPVPIVERDATHRPRVWLRITRRPCRDAETNNEITTKPPPKKALDEELTEALNNTRVILQIDLATRSLFFATSIWVLIGSIILSLFGYLLRGSQLVVKNSINKLGQKGLLMSIIKHQGPEIVHIFSIAADPKNYPIVLSCSVGKDRTGLVAALLLAAVDVKFDAILSDFCNRTNDALTKSDVLLQYQKELGLSDELQRSHADALKAVFSYITKTYGGVQGYLRHIGVSVEQVQAIRSILTAPYSC